MIFLADKLRERDMSEEKKVKEAVYWGFPADVLLLAIWQHPTPHTTDGWQDSEFGTTRSVSRF